MRVLLLLALTGVVPLFGCHASSDDRAAAEVRFAFAKAARAEPGYDPKVFDLVAGGDANTDLVIFVDIDALMASVGRTSKPGPDEYQKLVDFTIDSGFRRDGSAMKALGFQRIVVHSSDGSETVRPL